MSLSRPLVQFALHFFEELLCDVREIGALEDTLDAYIIDFIMEKCELVLSTLDTQLLQLVSCRSQYF